MIEHLSQGSSEPPLVDGKLRLYGMRFCPYDHRVHLVLSAKNIPHDCVFIDLGNKPDWYVKKVPSTKVPGLIIDGESLFESLIIADFLDEKYPQRPLHSKDPLRKAQDRILIDRFGKVTTEFYRIIKSQPDHFTGDSNALEKELLVFDRELAVRGKTFFAGDEPGMVDYMMWPWFERLDSLKTMFGKQFDLPETKFKNLVPWIRAMKEDKAVKEYSLSPEVYVKYLKSYIAGSPDYNIST